MIKELNHVGLFTGDMDASKNFYGNILGGIFIRDALNSEGKSQYVYVQLALGVIELIRVPANAQNRGYAHVAYLTNPAKPIEEYHEYLVGKGYAFTVPPKPTSAGDGMLAFFKDDSDAVFELIQRDENIRVRDNKTPGLTAFHHIAIYASPDAVVKCEPFYTNDMGFMKKDAVGGSVLYTIDADALLLIETADEALLAKPLSHICLSVESCAAMRAHLESSGVVCGELEKEGAYTCFKAAGPDGEVIIFTEAPAGKALAR